MKAIFMTGQSDRRSCALSPIQQEIANKLSVEGIETVSLNFPYDTTLAAYRSPNVLAASLSNSLQFLSSRRASFAACYRDGVLKQFHTDSSYLVLAGSCGLELFNNLCLPKAVLDKTHIMAYGPVARHLPKSEFTTIQGQRDWVSKCFFRRVDYQVNCGHMDYLECPQFVTLLLDKACSIAG